MTLIKKVGPLYDGDRAKGERDFERAKSNISELEDAISKLEMALKKETGYDKYILPQGIDKKEISLPNCPVTFLIRSEYRTTKKPPYKEITNRMEGHLRGIIFNLSRGRTITGIAKENNLPYIGVEKLRDDFDIIVGGVLEDGLEQTLTYKLDKNLEKEEPFKELEIPENSGAKTRENFIFYIRASRVKKDEENYIKFYEKDYAKDLKKKDEIKEQVSSERKVIAKKEKINEINWGAVVKTIITIPVRDAPIGELDNILSMYESHKLNEIRKVFPWYDIVEREARNMKILYVSIPSVDDRIQDLKAGIPRIKWKRYYIDSIPV